ncbi:MAG TPA: protein kinase [Terriglobales bacterium]|nr:protein kinase [Terriglobales bacterium]
MALTAGAKLGPYEILSPLGAGGMGEVYRARDSKLDREVALKVLPPEFGSDPERMARFAREAQVLASLNHPNVAHIYGLEDSGGVRALVMELVEGSTLAERIQQRALSLDDSLGIAKQIAGALEYAHEQGIVHRDLKPANVKVTPDGTVKVLDFGLAKAIESTPAKENISNSPTLSMAATQAGVILGTAAYMSPEQAKGKTVDRRADIWAFGVVLYEMLAGKQLYEGETAPETLAHVITKEPSWDSLPASTPTAIRHLLERCLTKDPRTRLQAIGEARIIIERYLANPSASTASIERLTVEEPSWRQKVPWAIAFVLAVAAGVMSWALWRRPPVPADAIRLSAEIGAPGVLAVDAGAAVIVSPDGSKFVFRASETGANRNTRLYVRQRDQLQATPLAGTEAARNQFFSPDGQWIGFFADGKLKKIPAQGGTAVTLCDAPSDRGGTWSEDGTIIFAAGTREGLSKVPEAGGTPQPLTTLDESKGEITHRWPQALPGGKVILFTAHNNNLGFDDANIVVQILKTGERKIVHQGGTYARYAPSGHLLFAHENTIFAAPFDLGRLVVTGPPVPFLEHVLANPLGGGHAQFDFSRTGTLVYVAGETVSTPVTISWMDKEGRFQPLRATPGDYYDLRFSPDGKRLAFTIHDRTTADIWVYDWERDTTARLTFGPGKSAWPVWTPDGQRIAFVSDREGSVPRMFWVRADGTGTVERLLENKDEQIPFSFSPDGKFLIYGQLSAGTNWDIWILPIEGDEKSGWKPGTPRPFLKTPAVEFQPQFSPDGRWLAYMLAGASGTPEVYVSPFPGPGGNWQISNGGGVFPTWSRNGKELFFRTNDDHIMVSTYRVVGDSFQADKPQLWSPGQVANRGPWRNFDLTPDGKRFAVTYRQPSQEPAEMKNDKFVVLLDVFTELRRVASPPNK